MRAGHRAGAARPPLEALSAELVNGGYRDATEGITVTCATDGNHGRAVAWGAQRFHCGCVIFVHESVSQGRVDAIARYGAEVRRVPGTYDDAVREAARQAAGERLVRRLRHVLDRLHRGAASRSCRATG